MRVGGRVRLQGALVHRTAKAGSTGHPDRHGDTLKGTHTGECKAGSTQLDLNPRIIAAVKKGVFADVYIKWLYKSMNVHTYTPYVEQAYKVACPSLGDPLVTDPGQPVLINALMLECAAAKLRSVKEVLHLSGPDLQRLTRLSGPDVQRLLRAASSHLRGSSVCTALQLLRQKRQRLSLGCPVLDGLLRGGLPLDGITELAGRSSAGKTQLALQLCLAVQLPRRHGGLGAGAVYVCTEDAFPSRRLQQLIAQQQRLRTDVPGDVVRKIQFGHQIFIEHAADVDTLLECVRKKVPVLLSRGMARLVVIDSVAAPFRCEFDQASSALRARRLQALGAELRRLSCTFRSPVLCVNQVGPPPPPGRARPGGPGGGRVLTAADPDLDPPGDGIRGGAGCSSWAPGVSGAPEGRGGGTRGSTHSTGQSAVFCLSVVGERVSPALGITWSNQLLVRLMADRQRPEEAASAPPRRTLRVVSAPHLPPSSCSYTVTAEGVRGRLEPSPADMSPSPWLGSPHVPGAAGSAQHP
eukprot:bmy_05899T0